MIFQCKLWCYSKKMADLGVDTEEWLDFAIDLGEIACIKSTGDGDGIDSVINKASVYLKGIDVGFVIDKEYPEMLKSWMRFKTSGNNVI